MFRTLLPKYPLRADRARLKPLFPVRL